MSGNEAADQVVSMSLRGIEVMAKISGEGAKHLAVYLYAVLQGQKQTRGRTRLENLLRSGKELKVFAVRNEDLPTFCKEAKRYGVLYCALRDKKNVDGLCDVMVRAEDASKINRIVERFRLATVDTASIKHEIEQARQEKQPDSMDVERTRETAEHLEPEAEETAAPETPISEDFFGRAAGKARTAGGGGAEKRSAGRRTAGTRGGTAGRSSGTGAAPAAPPTREPEPSGTPLSVRAYLRAQRGIRKDP
ncbi:PcfB family protein [Cohnella rhizosphaerae]|uniref:PcfB family protein n=1 Tax=Cohnella rhizosphaerae TaxID=1457232 RepID=A0A9X4KSE4_9BACL|nr:PcfB family protein [Cohnella rhizosphaerae]MDG0810321.1 PcfB family protein [Cohnella rhizosphaerae]